MPFNSLIFLYLFLPVSFLVCVGLRRISRALAEFFLICASFLFLYLGGGVSGVLVLTASILWNYGMGMRISGNRATAKTSAWSLGLGIAVNVSLLLFFKYTQAWDFLVPSLAKIGLPLALSFYTFGQIAYLIELSRGEIETKHFREYVVSVVFFPKLIAGPITRASEFFHPINEGMGSWDVDRILKGLSLFFIGLAKKGFIADQIEPYASQVFYLAEAQKAISFYHAWTGLLAYGMQLYFDFSGYCDMAIGIALIFGVFLPLNFDAPYRSSNITEFWRKWHMTLSSFLKDYVYIPLGGNRKGTLRKYFNLMCVMVLCGIWHGSWLLFVLWGAIHGLYLVIHNIWASRIKVSEDHAPTLFGRITGTLLTFFAVTIAWLPFRAESFGGMKYLSATLIKIPSVMPDPKESLLFLLIVLLPLIIVFFFPTSQKWVGYKPPVREKKNPTPVPAVQTSVLPTQNIAMLPTPVATKDAHRVRFAWKTNFIHGFITGCIALAGIISISEGSTFVYQNF